MSAMPHENEEMPGNQAAADQTAGDDIREATAPEAVAIRRNLALSLPVGAAAAAIGVAYLWRASTSGNVVDWVLCGVLAVVSAVYLAGLLDARTPLLVADHLGVRIRLGHQWRGLPWEAVEQVVVEPRRGRLRDGRLIVVPRSLGHALDGLERRGRRQAALNQKLYGAPLAVPLGLVTRVSQQGEQDIADRVAALSEGRADVVTLLEQPATPAPAEVSDDLLVEADESPVEHAEPRHHRLAVALGMLVSRFARGRSHDIDQADPGVLPDSPAPHTPAVPLRASRPSVRADVTMDGPLASEPEALRRLSEDRQLRRPGSVDLVFDPVPESNVRPIAKIGDPVPALVIDDFETQPAYDPVIGPQLLAARHRVGLSVDELAERTRIRPHVIESIEVDDFVPCGGDVYARGHIRTLARVLGQDPGPLLETFDNRYANAPISARRVFEAELATGMTGSMRTIGGGPNWTLLVGFVLVLVLVWGVVRLFAGEPNEMVENPPPLPDSAAAWPSQVYDAPAKSRPAVATVPVKLVALNAATRVQARNAVGRVVFAQRLVYGESKTVRLALPMTLSADNGGALAVTVGKRDFGLLGEADKPAAKRFGTDAAG